MPGIQDLREKRAQKALEMKNLTGETPRAQWTAAHEARFNSLDSEIVAMDSEIHRMEKVIAVTAERLGRDHGGAGGSRGGDNSELVAALGNFARTGDRGGFGVYAAALTEGADSGGVIVPHELADVIISTQKKYDPLRSVARVVSISTAASKYTQPIFNGGLDSGWVGETDPRPAGSISALESVDFPDAEVYANIPISAWLEEDTRIGQFVVQEIAKEFSRKEGLAFVSGTGTKMPLGFLASPQAATDDETRPLGTIQTVASGAADAITADSLVDLLYSLKPSYRARATWAMNSRTLSTVRRLKDKQDQYLWQPAIMAGQPELLLGRPVVELENLPDIAAGAIPVAVGDWSEGYHILDRTQMVLRDPFSAKPNVLFYARKRVSGAVVDSNALKLLKIMV